MPHLQNCFTPFFCISNNVTILSFFCCCCFFNLLVDSCVVLIATVPLCAGLDAPLSQYQVDEWRLTGMDLLQLTSQDLERMGVHKIGHQELILEAVEKLCSLVREGRSWLVQNSHPANVP